MCKTEYKRPTLAENNNDKKKILETWKRIDELKELRNSLLPEKPPPLAPPPEEVVEIQKAGQTINFENSAKITSDIFESPKSVATYIRSGLRQNILDRAEKQANCDY